MSESLTLEYNLYDLPTAQHKAGLAGMLLCIESLAMRRIEPVPVVEELTPTRAKIRFTRDSLQTLFDDLYDAEIVEQKVSKKWSGKQPKRIIETTVEENGKQKVKKQFVYDVLHPKGSFLQALYPPNSDAWIKLWRDMLWGTLRGVPKTRLVYEERAAGQASKLPSAFFSQLRKKQQKKEALTSSLFVGAMSVTAENVPFVNMPAESLLLHFWLAASLIYVPRVLEIKRGKEQGMETRQPYKGYVLVVPEPNDLELFCEDFKEVLQSLESGVIGYRPAAATIDLPEEGGLEFLFHLAKDKAKNSLDSIICAVEFYHLEKQGNNTRLLTAERIEPAGWILKGYEKMREVFFNPLFKSFRICNFLSGAPWWNGAQECFAVWPMELFCYDRDSTPKRPLFFGRDVKHVFTAFTENLKHSQGGALMNEEEKGQQFSLRIYQMIQTYVRKKAEERSKVQYKDFALAEDGKKRIYPKEYREAVEHVCSQAFLAMRGRRDKDFIEYFTGSICSVPQFLTAQDYQTVSSVLIEDWEQIKTLSMLALSACSYLPQPKKEQGDA